MSVVVKVLSSLCVCTPKHLPSHVVFQRTQRRLMSRHQKPEFHSSFFVSLFHSVLLSFILAPSILLSQSCAHVFTNRTTCYMTHNMAVVVVFRFVLVFGAMLSERRQ